MLGRQSPQRDIFDVGNVFPLELRPKSFHAQLAKVSPTLFSDDEFAALYCSSNGRPSVPPSQLALLMILQTYHGVSDLEAVDRSGYDLRWCAILGRAGGSPLCAKSTLQLFRAQLIVHEQYGLLFKRSLEQARKNGLLKGQEIKAALDTKPILGRGAVEDTYNLLATGMLQLARALAKQQQIKLPEFLAKHDLDRLAAPSVKGSADINWADEVARETFLTGLVADARKLMAAADGSVPRIKEAAQLLEQILLQDIEEHPHGGNASIKKGTVKGRVPSATDPEQRHGRKSAKKRFTGAKASVAADPQTGLILATEVLSGDSGDAAGSVELVEQAEANTGCEVTEVLADCAYGGGPTRQEFADAGRKFFAKVPSTAGGQYFPKKAFRIELPVEGQSLELTRVTCPAGAVAGYLSTETGGGVTFYFDDHCHGCDLRTGCTGSKHGRSLHIHAQERMISGARLLQESPAGRAKLRQRLVVENSLARLAAYGVGQARYIGHTKTRFQLSIAATVVNFRRTWNWTAAQETNMGAAGA